MGAATIRIRDANADISSGTSGAKPTQGDDATPETPEFDGASGATNANVPTSERAGRAIVGARHRQQPDGDLGNAGDRQHA